MSEPPEHDEPTPAATQSPARRLAGYAVLVAAIAVAIGVGAYLIVGRDSSSPASEDNLDATQVRNALGNPTPQPDTGVLEPQRPEEGKPAPDFALVDARDAGTIRKLSDFRGKVVIVNWFASWCGPCQQEIPEFNKLEAAASDQVVVLGVDYLEDAGAATGILDDLHATYPAVLDSVGVVAEHYRVGSGSSGLPQSFVVDKDGVLRAIIRGPATPAVLSDALAKAGVSYTAQ
jgi:cytochrome c biogenesis protein CcmG, thiol:disulfide interchange protein DsbE